MDFFYTSKMDQARTVLLTAQARYRAQSTPHEWQKFNEALRAYRQALKEEEKWSREKQASRSRFYG